MSKIYIPTLALAGWLCCIYCPTRLWADPPAGSQWEPIAELTDEFSGEKLDATKWYGHNPTWKGRQPGFFSKQNVTVSDGKLHLTVRVEDLADLPAGYHTFTTAADE